MNKERRGNYVILVKVEGSESFEVAKECVRSVKVTTDIPLDSNARTKDVGATMVITGKILAALDGDITDSTRKLALWSVVPAEKVDCYRKVTVEHVAGGVMERNIVSQTHSCLTTKKSLAM